jgi:class 3 adenylate cyclase
LKRQIELHQGWAFSTAGDSVMAEFGSAVGAARCAIDIQQEHEKLNAALPEKGRMHLRVGVDIGDLVVKDNGSVRLSRNQANWLDER